MVFCATDGHGRQDVTFPHQSEIKVNGGDLKANLRGLKNKPGSTRPVDITKELRLNPPTYSNNVEMTYALTNKASGSLPEVSCQHPLFSYIIYPLIHSFLRRTIKAYFADIVATEILSPYFRCQDGTCNRPGPKARHW